MSETLSPASFVATWQNAEPEAVAEALKNLLNARVHEAGEHLAWAEACEILGQPGLALREAQLALRDAPDDPAPRHALINLLRDRGQSDKALPHLTHLLTLSPDDPALLALHSELHQEMGWSQPEENEADDNAPWLPLPAGSPARPPGEEQAWRLLQWFSGREDTYARQWCSPDGKQGYTPVAQPLTAREVHNHLLGNVTLGVYCLRLDNTVRFLAIDLDINKSALEQARIHPDVATRLRHDLKHTALHIQAVLQELGLPTALENSGYKGRHLWVLLAEPLPADVAHTFGGLLMARLQPLVPPDLHLEFFPKQGQRNTTKGLGNLIKLPLGIHRRSGKRSLFLDDQGQAIADWEGYLNARAHTPISQVFRAIEALKATHLPTAPPPGEEVLPEAAPQLAPPPVQLPWTEADFETRPAVAHLFSSCAVLRALKKRVDKYKQLSQDEVLILRHSLGHLPEGVRAFNYLLARCGNVAPEQFLQSPLAGNPVSCVKIRKRIPEMTAQLPCACDFGFARDHYPTPTLHLRTLPADINPQAPPPEDLETLARRYATLQRRITELEKERGLLGNALAERLHSQAEPVLSLPEGTWRWVQQDEVGELIWEPRHA